MGRQGGLVGKFNSLSVKLQGCRTPKDGVNHGVGLMIAAITPPIS
jgi:hypothetical protein